MSFNLKQIKKTLKLYYRQLKFCFKINLTLTKYAFLKGIHDAIWAMSYNFWWLEYNLKKKEMISSNFESRA